MTNRFQVEVTALDKFTPTFDSLNKQAEKATATLAKTSAESQRWLGNLAPGLQQAQKRLQVPTSSIDALATLITPTSLMAGITATVAGVFALTRSTGHYAVEVDNASKVLGINAEKLQEWRAAARLAGSTGETITATFAGLGHTLQDARFGRNPQAAMVLRGLGIKTAMNADGSIDTETTARRVGSVMSGMDPLTRHTLAGVLGMSDEGAALLARRDLNTLRGMARGTGTVMGRDALDRAIVGDRGYIIDALKLEAAGHQAGASTLNPLANYGQRRAEMAAADATEKKMTDAEARREADALRGRFKPMSGAAATDATRPADVNINVTVPPGARVRATSSGPGVRVRRTEPQQ